MENYQKAKLLLSENKFEDAIAHFKKSFNDEVLNENEKIDCLTQIIKIQKLLNKKHDSDQVEKDLADFLIKRGDFTSASLVLKKLVDKKRVYEISFKLIETYVKDGSLINAEEECVALFKYLYRNKNVEKTQELYNYSKAKLPPNKKYDSFLFISYVAQGDIVSIEKIKDNLELDIIFEVLMGVPFVHWRHSKLYFDTLLEIAVSSKDYVLNKQALKLMLEVVLLAPKLESPDVLLMLNYFLKRDRKTVSRLLCNFAEGKGLVLDEKVTNKIDSMPEDEVVLTDLDFAEDLLSQKREETSEVEDMVKNILFLKSMGEDEEVSLLLNRLRKLDPANALLVKEEPGSHFREKRIEIADLEQEWNDAFRDSVDIYSDLESKAKATISSLNEEQILLNYKDLIVCFNTMDLPAASLRVLKIVEEASDEETLSQDLEFNYLKIKTLVLDQNYFEAYDLITYINGTVPIDSNKRIEFLYLQGEIARKLGRKKDAIKSYQLVRDINPQYRLVRQRLQSFG